MSQLACVQLGTQLGPPNQLKQNSKGRGSSEGQIDGILGLWGGSRFCPGLRKGYRGLARERHGQPAGDDVPPYPEEISQVWCDSEKQKQLAVERNQPPDVKF